MVGFADSFGRIERPQVAKKMSQHHTPHGLDAYWRSAYPDCEPISYHLRHIYRDRWVRFHCLPNSKRYPDDAAEYQVVLDRHNRVLGELSSPDEPLVFVSTGYSETLDPIRSYAELAPLDPDARHWRTIAKHDLDNDEHPNYWHFFMSVWPWRSGVFDPILRLVADEVIANTLIVNTQRNWVYHPYDGGADVVLETTAGRDRLKQQFKAWLSRRRDGL